MRIFLSWSGDVSKQVALALRDWLPSVVQAFDPWMSQEDLNKGTLWMPGLSAELENVGAAVICVTPDSAPSPWLNFEAGAMAKNVGKALVCPYYFGMKPTDVGLAPLAQFNGTHADPEDTRRMIGTLNGALSDKAIRDTILDKTFNQFWPELKEKLDRIQSVKEAPKRTQVEMLEEILTRVRAIEARPPFQVVAAEAASLKSLKDIASGRSSSSAFETKDGALSHSVTFHQAGREAGRRAVENRAARESTRSDGVDFLTPTIPVDFKPKEPED